jgi:eukaryotic-like serine/threonine-protein kinase
MKKTDSGPAIDERFLDHPYALAGRVVDPLPGTMMWNGEMTHIRRKELEVLALLASAHGAPVTRQAFINAIWDGNDLVGERGVNNTIFSLRRVLQDNDAQHPLIRTLPRRGYQLAVAVQQPVAVLPDAFAPGKTIAGNDGWRLVKLLGKTEQSESWLAEPSEYGDQDNTRRVFRFCRSEAHLRRLQREITLLRYVSQRLSERSDIVFIRDWQLDEPPYYLACDYLSFGSLHEWAQAQGGLPQVATLKIKLMQDLAEAMAALHAVGVVHRKFDADCVLVEQTAEGPRLKISAFGLDTWAWLGHPLFRQI